MRIEEVRVGCAPVPMRQPMKTAIHATTHTYNALVQIAAAGVTGQGAALTLAADQAAAVCSMIADLAPLLTGRDAREPRLLWEQLRVRLNLTGQTGIGLLALAAIDTALWDLHARGAGLPLYRCSAARGVRCPSTPSPAGCRCESRSWSRRPSPRRPTGSATTRCASARVTGARIWRGSRQSGRHSIPAPNCWSTRTRAGPG